MKILALTSTLMISTLSWAQVRLPHAIDLAVKKVHRSAGKSSVRNLFMFNYVYYAKGFCKDQDCSEKKIHTEMANAKLKMGDDFEKYHLEIDAYARAISYLQAQLPEGDLATLNGHRTYSQVLRSGVFVTCIDFAKAVMGKAIDLGFPKANLRMYVTMVRDAYKQMCPVPDGRMPILPRPVVHTLVAYQERGQWFALNVEDPQAIPLSLGTNLPDRLGIEHQFTFPALIAYQKLSYAGAYTAESFINGYPFAWLISITANGHLETDLTKVRCE